MVKKLLYDFLAGKDGSRKAMIAIHGWQGGRKSMRPLTKSININNMDWYFLEAPYPVDGVDGGYSWSYEKSDGVWEEDEPRSLLQDFLIIYLRSIAQKIYMSWDFHKAA